VSSLPSGHVGDLGAALVDEQLDPALRELVLLHMIGCVMCRHDVEEQRQLKARLQALREPGLPFSLFSKLSALDKPAALTPLGAGPQLGSADASLAASADKAGTADTADRADAVLLADTAIAPGRPLTHSSFLRDAHRGRRLLVGAASFLLVGAGAAYAAAGDGQPASPTQPSANVLRTNATEVSQSVPLNDPSFAAMTASFGH
jgi:hypothetical protein